MANPYRPANGIEGAEFQAAFCGRCACDPVDLTQHDGCPIMAATSLFPADHAEYPTQWRWSQGNPTCTAFRPRPEDWDGEPFDPFFDEAKAAQLAALPRDPKTGRPVI